MINVPVPTYIAQVVVTILSFAVVLSVHEAAHAGMAYLLGDDTARRMGRLSLNPLVHVDPLGLLCLLMFRIGWAKPVMFDHRNFKKPRLYSVLTAFAGPMSNFLLTLFLFVCLKFIPLNLLPIGISFTITQLFLTIAKLSVMLGVFNLLPLPPLDGSHILMALLINRFPRMLIWLYRYSLFILVGFFVLVPQFLSFLWFAIDGMYNFLHGLVF